MSDLWGSVANTTAYDPSSYNAGRTPSSELGKDDFLALLITQMKYQDPLEPTDNSQSMAQLAQFSALEQMQNVAQSNYQSQAYALIGKVVIGETYSEASGEHSQIFGRVDGVTIKSGTVYLVIGKEELELSGVKNVIDNPEEANQLALVNSNIAALQSLNTVGKIIQGVLTDDDNKPTEYIEGKVDYVKMVDGIPYLVVGTKEVRPELVMSVGNSEFILGKTVTLEKETDDGTDLSEGTIDKLTFIDGVVHISVNGHNEATAENISELTKLLSYLGKQITANGETGKADSVTINNGTVYLMVDGNKVAFKDISKVI